MKLIRQLAPISGASWRLTLFLFRSHDGFVMSWATTPMGKFFFPTFFLCGFKRFLLAKVSALSHFADTSWHDLAFTFGIHGACSKDSELKPTLPRMQRAMAARRRPGVLESPLFNPGGWPRGSSVSVTPCHSTRFDMVFVVWRKPTSGNQSYLSHWTVPEVTWFPDVGFAEEILCLVFVQAPLLFELRFKM